MKYIIVGSVENGNRYLRKESRQKQQAFVNEKCIELLELAKEIVIKHMAKQGSLKALNVLDGTLGAVLLHEILEKKSCEGYFVPRESMSPETTQEVWNSLEQLRMGAVTEDYENCTESRVLQIKELLQEYENQLVQREQYDIPRIYQTAIALLKSETVSGMKKHDCVVISSVYKKNIRAAELEFLELYTKGNYEELQMIQELKDEHLQGAKFFRSYGMANEVQYVFSQIQNSHQSYGDVEILYTASEYEPYIEAVFNFGKVPYTMVNRQLPAENDYLYVMKGILNWAENDFAYEQLKPVFIYSSKYRSSFYYEISAGIGWGIERYTDYVKRVRAELEKPEEELTNIEKMKQSFCEVLEVLVDVFTFENEREISYAKVFWKLVAAARRTRGGSKEYQYVSGALKQCAKKLEYLGTGKDCSDVIEVLSREIKPLTFSDEEMANAVCVQKWDGHVRVLERKHVYVIGLSTTHFSSVNTESPVLSDKELERLLDLRKGAVTLAREVEQKKVQALYDTLSTRIQEGSLTLGYSGYDTVNLRDLTPAIPFLRLLQKASLDSGAVENAEYQDIVYNNVNLNESLIWKDMQTEESDKQIDEQKAEDSSDEETTTWSPIECWSTTSLQELLCCPLQFYYHRVLKLPVEDYQSAQSNRWLSASEKGTLVHGIMEEYCNAIFLNKKADEIPHELQTETFEQIAEARIQKTLSNCPYYSLATYLMETELVKDKCRCYLERMHLEFSSPSNPWMVVACEKNFQDVNIEFNNGEEVKTLRFRGQIDRLDKRVDENGESHYRIIDYKSGGRDSHEIEINDKRNVQHVIYKKALEEICKPEKIKVDEVIYIHFFEENVQKQNYVLKDLEIECFPLMVSDFVVDFIKNPRYRKRVIGDEEWEARNKSCNYCTYKDICMEYIGDKL